MRAPSLIFYYILARCGSILLCFHTFLLTKSDTLEGVSLSRLTTRYETRAMRVAQSPLMEYCEATQTSLLPKPVYEAAS